MSKTRRKSPPRDGANHPPGRKPTMRRCDSCGESFTLEELSPDRDERGRGIGMYCGGCI